MNTDTDESESAPKKYGLSYEFDKYGGKTHLKDYDSWKNVLTAEFDMSEFCSQEYMAKRHNPIELEESGDPDCIKRVALNKIKDEIYDANTTNVRKKQLFGEQKDELSQNTGTASPRVSKIKALFTGYKEQLNSCVTAAEQQALLEKLIADFAAGH